MEKPFDNIIRSLDFLREVTQRRLQHHFNKQDPTGVIYPDLALEGDGGPLSEFIAHHQLTIEAYIIFLLGLVPHIQPNFLDAIIQPYLPNGGDFAEMGGVKVSNHRGMLPTGETALFILGGNDIEKRFEVSHYFSPEHFFAREDILVLESLREGEPRLSGRIILKQELVDLFTLGSITKPSFGPDFPAKNITTKMEWGDLILNPKTEQQVQDIRTWLDHNNTFMQTWGMETKVKPGYRALFHGPPGTGKTLTATLLGKQFQRDVYRIDLSLVVSKYIGETEKNLEKIFSKAEHKEWILFFDEADALFGKRSNVQNAHDKYANQEVSYLLQRVEEFSGLIILASNYKSNIDQAFLRRFNTIVHFPMPSTAERFALWENTFPPLATPAHDVDLHYLAGKYEVSGSAIVNVIHYASLQALRRQSNIISRNDLMEGIRREYEKEERVFSL
ncbi:ATP-binding protein [Chryseolinea lacunae]|uniref:ATP-binding protein n=1 Tax=Chryseolinea lacunae TaxID=2801331 RepID=A0ABS1KNW2_9BACT|nr:ATP-binding protein [Chryseolinea lacunae]MBL0741121.1 ATP-binding protein [Chryseolinea lacunae]